MERNTAYRVLSTRAILLCAIALTVIAAGAAAGLLLAFGGGGEGDRVRLEAIKTAGAIVIGTGGAAALWLAARRQRTTEIAMRHQERVAEATEADAAERRVTELYTKAVEQLGSEKAAVRLGGMYALERLAQNTPSQRQTIVNVLCAYLRMPYSPPEEGSEQEQWEPREQERQVRLTAQRVLAAHLQPGEAFWPDIDLDLTAATLVDFTLTDCRVRTARFDRADFTGAASFTGTEFARDVTFSQAIFRDLAGFSGMVVGRTAGFGRATFSEDAVFGKVWFHGEARFGRAEFGGAARFSEARFGGEADFSSARFAGYAWFDVTKFVKVARFNRVEFGRDAQFNRASFGDVARFDGSTFAGKATFTEARVRLDVPADTTRSWPAGHAVQASADGWGLLVTEPARPTG
ncbi:pentapeptide repeat-containing protein [Crossiella sp. NPDC003009]